MSESRAAVADAELDEDDILLTDAERAGMQDDDDDDTGGDDTAAGGQGDDTTTGAAGDDTAAGAGGADTLAGAEDTLPGFQPANVPPLRTEDTTAATARLAEIETESEKLAKDFDDGEMTAAEYRTANAALTKESADLNWTLRKSELSQEMSAQAIEAAWFASVGEFLNEHKTVLKPDTLVFQAFDLAVRQVTGDAANDALTSRQKLQKAYDRLTAELGIKPAEAAKPKAEPPPLRNLPPNLRAAPAASAETTDDGKYAALDRLAETDPAAFETRLGQMSEAEQDAYSRAR